MNVLFAVAVIILPAVFLFFTPVIIFDLLPWTKLTTSGSEGSKVVSTELQSRMKSFLMRNSVADTPLDNEFVIASHSSASQSHGSIHCNLFCNWAV